MDDLGRWMRRVLDEVAPPVDPRGVVESVTRPGRRWWPIAVGAAAVVVLLIGGGYWLFSGEPDTGVADDTTTTSMESATTSTSLTEPVVLEVLEPSSISCSSELPDFPCSNLIDGNPATEWQAPNGGIGAVITLEFAEPVSVMAIGFSNIVDESRFRRNARIRGVAMSTDGIAWPNVGELMDTNDEIQSLGVLSAEPVALVTELTISITSAYPAQSFGDQEPFLELALAELEIIGYPGVFPPEGPTTVTTEIAPVVEVISAADLPQPPRDVALPYPESMPLEPVTQAEIDAGLGDVIRDLAAANPDVASPSDPVVVRGRIGGVLLFTTFFDVEGMCIHGFDGSHHSMACGGSDGSWTGAIGPVSPAADLYPEAAATIAELEPFVVLVVSSSQPWVAVETEAETVGQYPSGSTAAFLIPLADGPQTLRFFGPEDFPESLDEAVVVNGTVAPVTPPDIVPGGGSSAIAGSSLIPPPSYQGTCLTPVTGGMVPCTGDVWRRLTFVDPALSISIPITWQAGAGGFGLGNAIRLSSVVEELPLQLEDITGCALSGIPLLSAGPDDVVLHIRELADAAGLPTRPADFAYPGVGITEYVPGPECAAARHLIEYDFAFVDQGTGVLIVRIASYAGGPFYLIDEILNSLTVGG